MSSTVTNVIDCYKWHRLLQVAPTVTTGIDCYKWHRLLQIASTVTNVIDRNKCHRRFQLALTVQRLICYIYAFRFIYNNNIESIQNGTFYNLPVLKFL